MRRLDELGFTLLELLIVVVIIGILSLIVVPGLTGNSERANIARGKQLDASLLNTLGADAPGIWDLNEDSGASASNASHSGPGCTLGGTSYNRVAGFAGNGVAFIGGSGGGGGHMNCGNSVVYDTSEFTISMWIKPTSINTDNGNGNLNSLLRRETYTVSGFRMGYNTNGRVAFWTTESGGTITLFSGNHRVSTSRFYHVAVSYSNGTAKMYVDGKLANTATGNYVVPSGNILYFNYGTDGADVIMDSVRFYNKALETAAIQRHYALGQL